MTKQEYIAFGYLSGLKCHLSGLYNIDHTDNGKVNPITVEIVGIGLREVEIHEIGRTITEHYEICDCFPILHPLSDLTKEIEHNGERFMPIDVLCELHLGAVAELHGRLCYFDGDEYDCRIEFIPFGIINMLVKWHFDIAGLIQLGEAVDISTLSQNPYA